MSLRPAGCELSDSDDDDITLGSEVAGNGKPTNTYVNDWRPRPGYEGGFGPPPRSSSGNTAGRRSDAAGVNNRRPHRTGHAAKPVVNGVVIEELKAAVVKDSAELVQLYLSKGVPVDIVTASGWTPLMYAASNANVKMVKLLLDKGADPNFAKEGHTVLMTACLARADEERDIADCVSALVAAGALVLAKDWQQMTSLILAAKRGHILTCELLLQKGAEVDRQDKRGWTALCYAATSGKVRLVRLLLDNGADATRQCSDGQTAADIADSLGHTQVAGVLRGGSTGTDVPTVPTTGAACGDAAAAGTKVLGDQLLSPVSDLEMFLCGLDLKTLIPVFRRHEVTFDHFLRMTDLDLQKVGVTQVGVRKKLLDAVHEVHKKDWEPGSVAPSCVYTKCLMCADMIAMAANIQNHLKHIASSFVYMSGQVSENPQLLDPGNDGKAIDTLKYQLLQCKESIHVLSLAATRLEDRMSEALSDSSTDSPDVIRQRTTAITQSSHHTPGQQLFLATSATVAVVAATLGLAVVAIRSFRGDSAFSDFSLPHKLASLRALF